MSTRLIHGHEVNPANQMLEIRADEPNPENGNASHNYTILHKATGRIMAELSFQDGPIQEVGVNGITHEALLAIIADRLRGFQTSKFACRENALVLTKVEEAQHWLHHRTRMREARGVEGTHQV